RTGYDHRNQPAIKIDHFPDDWEATWAAARNGETKGGRRLDPSYPVTGVDWWDACAYANWRGGRLPTLKEWMALSRDVELEPGERGPVDGFAGDVTPGGIHGLAGNVSEWVQDAATNPATPGTSRGPLACGASFLEPRDGALAQSRLSSHEVRRRDLGFRIVRDTAP
nr:SUMF1/EgtB/PvdO family nonheme iron enzyme [Akkermansiaceae bacterium]